ncbi:MAG: GxxExxY protein [Agriterribacter sp.]
MKNAGVQIWRYYRKNNRASIRIHNTLGNGFPEMIYQRALALELKAIGVSFEREFDMPIYYMNEKIGSRRVDFLVEQKISVELKALIKLENGHLAQAMNYLEVYNLEIGLLINFGNKKLEFNRFTNKKFKS